MKKYIKYVLKQDDNDCAIYDELYAAKYVRDKYIHPLLQSTWTIVRREIKETDIGE